MSIKALVAVAAAMIMAVLATHQASADQVTVADAGCIAYGAENAVIQQIGNGDTVVFCHFEDNRMCTLTALATGDCVAPGRKVTGYFTEAAMYCARSGGEVEMLDDDDAMDASMVELEGTCQLPNGTSCMIAQMYYGHCGG